MEQLSDYSCKSNRKRINIYELLSASFEGVQRIFAFAYTIVVIAPSNKASIKDNKKYFLPRGKTKDYNVLNDVKGSGITRSSRSGVFIKECY